MYIFILLFDRCRETITSLNGGRKNGRFLRLSCIYGVITSIVIYTHILSLSLSLTHTHTHTLSFSFKCMAQSLLLFSLSLSSNHISHSHTMFLDSKVNPFCPFTCQRNANRSLSLITDNWITDKSEYQTHIYNLKTRYLRCSVISDYFFNIHSILLYRTRFLELRY